MCHASVSLCNIIFYFLCLFIWLMILLLYIHIYISIYIFFIWTDFYYCFLLDFRNNCSDRIVLGIGLLNSNAVEQFEGQYFSLVTNILKDLEVEEKNSVQKSHCLRLFLSVWIPVAIWNVLALLLLVLLWRTWQKERQNNKELRISFVKTPAKRDILKSLDYIYW